MPRRFKLHPNRLGVCLLVDVTGGVCFDAKDALASGFVAESVYLEQNFIAIETVCEQVAWFRQERRFGIFCLPTFQPNCCVVEMEATGDHPEDVDSFRLV